MANKIRLKIVLVAGLLLGLSSTASAFNWGGRSTGYLYEKLFNNMGEHYLSLLEDKATDNPNNLTSDKRSICLKRYGGILNDGVLDIRIALGYFDWTTGSNVGYSGRSYGLSPSMDIGAFEALKELLTSRCSGNARFCGFQQSSEGSSVFVRDVMIHGRRIQARVEIRFSSQSEILSDNLGRYREQQRQRTQYMENYFSKALREADAVFYFGHSRNGGGPDFAPPVFIGSTNKLDYSGYYKAQRPGFKKMLNALSSGSKQAPVLGLMSCASRDHFLSRTRAAAPNSGIITSMDVLNVDEVYTAMIGGVDALLRGQCQQSFYQSIRMTNNNQKFITMDGMFE
ncbi:hypothetical protein [Bdellovibrio bacteriovorus]|uniref:hypothetical protein n=1 Tax=Bdellovibrio bacteriovorus TaxID=959 RepID=UPI0035A5AB56